MAPIGVLKLEGVVRGSNLKRYGRLEELRGKTIAVDAVSWLTSLREAGACRNDALQALRSGRCPLPSLSAMQNEMEAMKSFGLNLIFVFEGIDRSDPRGFTSCRKQLFDAWTAAENGKLQTAASIFHDSSWTWSDDDLMTIQNLMCSKFKCITAPCNVYSQIAVFVDERRPHAHAVLGKVEAVLYGASNVITAIDFAAGVYQFVAIEDICHHLHASKEQLVDATLLAGHRSLPTFPLLLLKSKFSFQKALKIAKQHNSAVDAARAYPCGIDPSYVCALEKARTDMMVQGCAMKQAGGMNHALLAALFTGCVPSWIASCALSKGRLPRMDPMCQCEEGYAAVESCRPLFASSCNIVARAFTSGVEGADDTHGELTEVLQSVNENALEISLLSWFPSCSDISRSSMISISRQVCRNDVPQAIVDLMKADDWEPFMITIELLKARLLDGRLLRLCNAPNDIEPPSMQLQGNGNLCERLITRCCCLLHVDEKMFEGSFAVVRELTAFCSMADVFRQTLCMYAVSEHLGLSPSVWSSNHRLPFKHRIESTAGCLVLTLFTSGRSPIGENEVNELYRFWCIVVEAARWLTSTGDVDGLVLLEFEEAHTYFTERIRAIRSSPRPSPSFKHHKQRYALVGTAMVELDSK